MTSNVPFRIFPLGDSALTVEFGDTISAEINDIAISLAEHLEADRFPGFIESVPAFASTTIYYNLVEIRKHFGGFPTAFDAVSALVYRTLDALKIGQADIRRRIEIPVDFSPSAALDLDELAGQKGLSRDEVIAIFTSREYRVYMLGFLPGFSYMGEVDERIASPRKESPRTEVPAGSIGIAGTQTGIYSLRSPGGWQIIGRTPLDMFDVRHDPPAFLRAGDIVSFVATK